MKRYKILTAAIAAAVLSGASAMAQFNYQNGDLIAAFGNGGSTDVLVDLGSISTFQNGALPPTTFDLNAVLTSVFGSVNGSIYWSVFGVNDTGVNTIWNTLKRANPAVKSNTPFVAGNNDVQQLTLGDIQSIANNTVPGGAGPGLITDFAPGIELVDTSLGGYTPMMTGSFSGNFQGDWTYNILNNGVGTSDLYQSDPGSHLTQRAIYLGNFSLSAGGILAFNPVPEPSTWAMIGSGMLTLIALRRRNK